MFFPTYFKTIQRIASSSDLILSEAIGKARISRQVRGRIGPHWENLRKGLERGSGQNISPSEY